MHTCRDDIKINIISKYKQLGKSISVDSLQEFGTQGSN